MARASAADTGRDFPAERLAVYQAEREAKKFQGEYHWALERKNRTFANPRAGRATRDLAKKSADLAKGRWQDAVRALDAARGALNEAQAAEEERRSYLPTSDHQKSSD